MEDSPLLCHRCAAELEAGKGQFYVVRIEAYADPMPPNITAEDLKRDTKSEIDRLINELGTLSDQEIMDQVYRRMFLYLCCSCYQEWIENPVG